MDFSNENLEYIHRPEVKSAELMAQIDGLIEVLVELKILDQEQEQPALDVEYTSVDGVSEEVQLFETPQIALPTAEESNLIPPAAVKIESNSVPETVAHIENNSEDTEIDEKQAIELISDLILLGGNESAGEITAAKTETEIEADSFKRLQDLLMGPEVEEVRDLVAYVDEKVGNLERQIYEPSELLNLLLPLIAQLLSRKVEESKGEVVSAIAPILDDLIESRADQDRQAMSAAIAPLISEAIAKQYSKHPKDIVQALGPAMGQSIKQQIILERDAMVDALYPIIGGTIAKYLAEAIRNINEKVSEAFSVEGIKRKISAKIKGVSEAELILKEAIPFSVQAIFLIHKTSGLVISQVQPYEQGIEADMIAGMLTAIRSFVNDCIAQSGEISELDAIDYGNSQIILEVAGHCYLAVITKGDAPKQFLEKMRQTLVKIIVEHGKPIETFDGDPDSVPPQVKSLLETLIEIPAQQATNRSPVALIGIGLAALSIIVVPWGIYSYRNAINRSIEAKTVQALASSPELAVYRLNVKADGKKLRLEGKLPSEYLRSQAEQIARNAAPNSKLYNEIIAVEVPADPVLAAAEVKRVTSILNQTNGVLLKAEFKAGKVTLSGTANSFTDAKKITQAFAQIPGVKSVTNTIQLQPLKIDTRIYFERNSAQLTSVEASDKINQIKAFLSQHPETKLKIIAHTDKSGSPEQNQQLSLWRAKTVQNALIRAGVAPQRLEIEPTVEPPLNLEPQTPALSRVVQFEPIPPTGIKQKSEISPMKNNN